MNEINEIRYNKILSQIKILTYILDKCGERMILKKFKRFSTNEELLFILNNRLIKLKEKIVSLKKLLEV